MDATRSCLQSILGKNLREIWVQGWIPEDDDSSRAYVVSSEYVLDFDSTLVRFSNGDSVLVCEAIDSVAFNYDVFEIGKSVAISIGEFMLRCGGNHSAVRQIDLYSVEGFDGIDAILFTIGAGSRLFLEVDLVKGLHLSAAGEETRWKEWLDMTSQKWRCEQLVAPQIL